MEIGIISDTHISSTTDYTGLLNKVQKAFAGVELILHAGDVTNIKFVNDLEKITQVEAVIGNMDDETIRKRFQTFNKIEVFSKKIGLIHQMPSFSFVKQEGIDILVTGHTHIPIIQEYFEEGHMFLHLNPGSPMKPRAPPLNKRYLVQRKAMPTVIVLDIDEELSSAYMVTLK
jgi:putative phosphoesterase